MHKLGEIMPTSKFGYFPTYSTASVDALADVEASNPNNDDVLKYDSANKVWKNATVGASTLNSLQDVDAPAPNDKDVIKFDAASQEWKTGPVLDGNYIQTNETATVDNTIAVWDGTTAGLVKDTAITVDPSTGAIQNIGTPLLNKDATTKEYVDSLVVLGSIAFGEPVNVASTGAIDLVTGGLIAVDGHTLVAGERVLVKDGSTANPGTTSADNGVYVAGIGAWTRSTAEAAGTTASGKTFSVTSGVSNGGGLITCNTTGANFGDPIFYVRVASFGDIDGPGASTDNALTRWDGTDGGRVQDSLVSVDDSGNLVTPGGVTTASVTASGAVAASGAVSTGDSLVLEDPGAGTETVTLKAPSGLPVSYTFSFPSGSGEEGSYLVYGVGGQTYWRRTQATGSNPTALSDVSVQYTAGSVWTNTSSGEIFVCQDASAGAAVWRQVDNLKYNMAATTDPGASDDETQGYSVGSLWLNNTTSDFFVAASVATGAASWKKVSGISNNLAATTDPGASDDASAGWQVSSLWVNTATQKCFIALDVSAGAAVWKRITNIKNNGAAILDPVAADDSSQGYEVTSTWVNATLDRSFICCDASPGAAVWKRTDDKQSNLTATTDPTSSNDASQAYEVGSLWLNVTTNAFFLAASVQVGAAAWVDLSSVVSNLAATTDPQASDDQGAGYTVNSVWLNTSTNVFYKAADVSTGAAVWKRISNILNTYNKSSDPTVNSDSSQGFEIGSIWYNLVSDTTWICWNASVGAANWKQLSNVFNSLQATRDPVSSDDVVSKFQAGSLWYNSNTSKLFACIDNSLNAAVWVRISNLKVTSTTSNPGSGDDESQGYDIGSTWVNTFTRNVYICVKATTGSAKWKRVNNYFSNLTATTDPSSIHDTASDYEIGSLWLNTATEDVFVAYDVSAGAARWERINRTKTTTTTTSPLATDDSVQGYEVGSSWIDTTTSDFYVAVDVSANAAVWKILSTVKNRIATDPPDANEDNTKGYTVNSIWTDTGGNASYICSDASTGAARWNRVGQKNVYDATTAPTATDDSASGFSVGSVYVDVAADKVYTLVDATPSAAVWTEGGGGGGGGSMAKFASGFKNQNQSLAPDTQEAVEFDTWNGDIVLDAAKTGFYLQGGSRYLLNFTPYAHWLGPDDFVRWGIVDKSSSSFAGTFTSHMSMGNSVQKKRVCRLSRSSDSGGHASNTFLDFNSVDTNDGFVISNGRVTLESRKRYRVAACARLGPFISGGYALWEIHDGTTAYASIELASMNIGTNYGDMTSCEAFVIVGSTPIDIGIRFRSGTSSEVAGGTALVIEELDPTTEAGDSSLTAVFEPETSGYFSIANVAGNGSETVQLLGSATATDRRTNISITELTYSSFNPAPAYMQVTAGFATVATIAANGNFVSLNSVQASGGSGITLNTSTGLVSLAAGRTYKITGKVTRCTLTNSGFISIRDDTAGQNIGNSQVIQTSQALVTETMDGFASAYFTPTVTSNVGLYFVTTASVVEMISAFMNVEVLEGSPRENGFSGATQSTSGTEGLVPAPAAGAQFACLLGNASFRMGVNQAWNFGEVKQIWSPLYGDPTTSAKIPMSFSGFQGNLSNPPVYVANKNDTYIELLNNTMDLQRTVNWDQGSSPLFWEMRGSVKISNTGQCADMIFFFGNDTIQNVSAGPSGSVPSDSTGICVAIDTYDSGNEFRRLVIYEAGTQVFNQKIGQEVVNDRYFEISVSRRDDIVRVEISGMNGFGICGSVLYEHTLSNSSYTGTRWGLGGFTGSQTMFSAVSKIECRVLE